MLRERGNELFKQRNYNKAILHYDMGRFKFRLMSNYPEI